VRRIKKDVRTAYFLIAPAFALFLVFSLYPLLWSARISLTSWDGLNATKKFIGTKNYSELLRNPEFLQSFRVTVAYVLVVTMCSTVIGFLLALALSKRIKSSALYRTIFFSPVVTATVAAGVVWQLLFDPFSGLFNVALRAIGLEGPNWLGDPKWSLIAVSIVGIWKRIGFAMIIFAAGIASLPISCYEAAKVDGATGIKLIRHMTIPLLKPVTALVVITGVIDSIQVFDHIFVMTNGGPMGSTNVLSMYLYNQGFRVFHLGMASAVGWLLFALILAVTVFQWQFTKGAENE
jgi:ABC-type sugar transport system permease subunit